MLWRVLICVFMLICVSFIRLLSCITVLLSRFSEFLASKPNVFLSHPRCFHVFISFCETVTMELIAVYRSILMSLSVDLADLTSPRHNGQHWSLFAFVRFRTLVFVCLCSFQNISRSHISALTPEHEPILSSGSLCIYSERAQQLSPAVHPSNLSRGFVTALLFPPLTPPQPPPLSPSPRYSN
jgi:hypothetical protein